MALNSGPFECALQPESEVLRTQRPTWRVLLRKRVDPSKPTTPDVNFPRLRALALFGRLTAERAKSLVIASVQKPAHKPTIHTDRADYSTDNPGRASSTAL